MEKAAEGTKPPTEEEGRVGEDDTGSKGTGPKGKTMMKGKDGKGKGKDIKGKGKDIKGKGKDVKGKGKDIKGKGKDIKGKGKDVKGNGKDTNGKGSKGHLAGDSSSGQKGKGKGSSNNTKGDPGSVASTSPAKGAGKTEAEGRESTKGGAVGEQAANGEETPLTKTPAIGRDGKTDKAKVAKSEPAGTPPVDAKDGEVPGTKAPAVGGKGSGKTKGKTKTKGPGAEGKADKDTKEKDQQRNDKHAKRPEGHVDTHETEGPRKIRRTHSSDVKTPPKEGTAKKAVEGMPNS